MDEATRQRSALLVTVAELDPVVREHRARLDASAVVGVPAHVTVLYPFLPVAELTPAVTDRLTGLFAPVAGFDCVFDAIRWFREDLVWVAPAPDTGFRELTRVAAEAFPRCRPYGGKHGDPVPHLTLGDRRVGPVEALREAAALVEPELPVAAAIREVRLMAGGDQRDSWRTLATFPLARA